MLKWWLLALALGAGAPKPAGGQKPPGQGVPLKTQREIERVLAEPDGPIDLPSWRTFDGGMDQLRTMDLSPLVDALKTSQDDGGLPFAKYRWNVPDLEHYVDVPAVQIVNGLPVRFSAAVSRAKPDFLVKYYVAEFEKAGLFIPPADEQMQMAPPAFQLTALDTDNLISFTVILQVTSDKTTTVIMAQGYLEPWMRRKPAGADFAPVFPQAEAVVRSTGEGVDVLQYVTDAEPTAVRAFYADVMKKAGYVEPQRDVFVRGAERISLKVAKAQATKKTGVMLQKRLGGAGAEPLK